MCSRADCQRHVGKYVRFQTPYGYHEGVIESVRGNQAVVLSPRKFIPVQLASQPLQNDEQDRLDIALAWGGFGGGYGGRGGYGGGGYGGYGGRGGYGGGGYGGYGWGRWAVSFLIIYVLWGLWF